MANVEGKTRPEKADSTDKNLTGDISSDGGEIADVVNERTLLRKLDIHLLPAVGLLYLISFLDRSNGRLSLREYPPLLMLTKYDSG